MNSPLVSVCIPVHNITRFLDEAIVSVLTQTYGNFELVIANGASQPEPRRLIDEIVSRNSDPRVQLILNPANYSMVENWNSAIMKARGIYLKLLCADDVLMPDCLQRQVQAMQMYPAVVLAAGSRVIINGKGVVFLLGMVLGPLEFTQETNLSVGVFFLVLILSGIRLMCYGGVRQWGRREILILMSFTVQMLNIGCGSFARVICFMTKNRWVITEFTHLRQQTF